MATKKPEDDFEFSDRLEKKPGEVKPKEGDGKDYTAAAGANALMDVFTFGNQEAIGKKLRGVADYLGISGPHKIDKSAKDIATENPYSTAFGTALGYALPVAGAETMIGNAARGAGSALGGESALATAGRAALAEGGVSALQEGGRAATGNEADWMNPIYNAAFGGILGGFGQKAADLLKSPTQQAGKAIRGKVGAVPEGTPLPGMRPDPTGTIPAGVAQTAPEALQAAGLGKQAGDAEAMLQQVLGGKPAAMPGREAAFQSGTAARNMATDASKEALERVGQKAVQSPFGATPDLQDIHFKTAGTRPPGDTSLFGYNNTLQDALQQSAGNPAMQRQIDDALAHLHGQGYGQVGDLMGAEAKGTQFQDFTKSFGGVTPTPGAGPKPPIHPVARQAIDFAMDLIPGGRTMTAIGKFAVNKVLDNLPASIPKNPEVIERILKNPEAFSSILKPEEIAELTKFAAGRSLAATTVGEGLPNSWESNANERQKQIKREFGR